MWKMMTGSCILSLEILEALTDHYHLDIRISVSRGCMGHKPDPIKQHPIFLQHYSKLHRITCSDFRSASRNPSSSSYIPNVLMSPSILA